jgi:MFS family permease
VLTDRAPKGLLLAAINAARVGFCLVLAISTDNVAIIYIIAVLFAVAGQFSGPAESAALPAVVPPEDFTAANSLNNLGGLISQVAGIMILPAVFLKTVGPEALAIVCAAMFAAAAFNFLLIEGLGGPVSDVRMSIDDARERFAQAWHRLTLDSVAYISVVIMVVANTVGLIVATLVPRFASQVLDISTENAIFVVTPAALGIWLALRFVRGMAGRVSPWWSVGGSFAALAAGVALCGLVPAFGDRLEAANLFGAFDPGPFGEGTARIIITMALALVLAFAFTFVNVVARSVVNERMPRDMQGRVFAAQGVLTNLLSIPPILFAGILADLTSVTFVFFIVGAGAGMCALYFAARNLTSPTRVAR